MRPDAGAERIGRDRFAGLTILLTGAGGGFGRAAAAAFAAEGARLILSDRDARALASVADPLHDAGHDVARLAGDVTDPTLHERLVALAFDRFGSLDVAVNNAGIVHPFARLHQIDPADAERVIAVDLLSVFLALRAQIPAMERQFSRSGRRGAILNMASVAGVIGAPLLSVYAAAKHGVVGLTKSAAGESARKGVRINALCPGFAETPMVDASMERMLGTRDERANRIVGAMPMQRLGTSEEIASAMLSVCDPANSFMTGAAIAVDGGLSAV